MEPIKLSENDLTLYKDLEKAAEAATQAAKLYEIKHNLFWTTIKEKNGLTGVFVFNEDAQTIIEEKRRG